MGKTHKKIKQWSASAMGKKGGTTKGAAKVRGDAEYYRRIRLARETKEKLVHGES
jgi:hypothetical protein